MSEAKTYRVVSPLEHNGKAYGINSAIDSLSPEQAGALLEKGIISDPSISQTGTGIMTDSDMINRQDDTIRVLNAELEKLQATNVELEDALAKAKKVNLELAENFKLVDDLNNKLLEDLDNAKTHIAALEKDAALVQEETAAPAKKASKAKR